MPKRPVTTYRAMATKTAPQLNWNGAKKQRQCKPKTTQAVPISIEFHFLPKNTLLCRFTTTSDNKILLWFAAPGSGFGSASSTNAALTMPATVDLLPLLRKWVANFVFSKSFLGFEIWWPKFRTLEVLDTARGRTNTACSGPWDERRRGENWWGLGLDGGDMIKAMNGGLYPCMFVCDTELWPSENFKENYGLCIIYNVSQLGENLVGSKNYKWLRRLKGTRRIRRWGFLSSFSDYGWASRIQVFFILLKIKYAPRFCFCLYLPCVLPDISAQFVFVVVFLSTPLEA